MSFQSSQRLLLASSKVRVSPETLQNEGHPLELSSPRIDQAKQQKRYVEKYRDLAIIERALIDDSILQ